MCTNKFFIVLLLFAPVLASAAVSDVKTPLICAASEVTECSLISGCTTGSPESFNLSNFMQIDLDKKTLTSPRRKTKIERIVDLDDRLVLQGVEEGRGWSLEIAKATGRVALAIAGLGDSEHPSFVIFGACTALPLSTISKGATPSR